VLLPGVGLRKDMSQPAASKPTQPSRNTLQQSMAEQWQALYGTSVPDEDGNMADVDITPDDASEPVDCWHPFIYVHLFLSVLTYTFVSKTTHPATGVHQEE
jgi:hypothetical protein